MADCTLYYGSLCFTDIQNALLGKHSAFTKGANGKIYFNINVWVNEEKDKYGNDMGIQLNPKVERKDIDKKMYVGNAKLSSRKETPVSDKDVQNIEPIDDLPF